jgi:hypothetical protein
MSTMAMLLLLLQATTQKRTVSSQTQTTSEEEVFEEMVVDPSSNSCNTSKTKRNVEAKITEVRDDDLRNEHPSRLMLLAHHMSIS